MKNDTHLIERIDDVRSFLERKGRYHTSTAHQAYGVLQALSWHPWVRLGEELFFPEGSVLFAEVNPITTLTPNVEKVGWGTTEDYYERRLRDYDNWEIAYWREIIQNSRDSGATNMELEVAEDTYKDPETGDTVPCMRVSATDNGSGMDYETLMTAFFRRGGTLKQEGSVGGFGDAKNLILTPWLGYEVRTQDVVARGRHEDLYADLTKQGLPYLHGTRVTVWMPMEKTTTAEHAQFLVEQSSLDIKFKVNGSLVKEKLPRGTLVEEKPIVVEKGYSGERTVGQLLVYHSPRAKRSGVYVRSHGLYMYEMHGWSGDFKGVVTVEVNAPPISVFTTKRDSLSFDSTARADVNDVMQRLTTDPRKALKAVRDKKEMIFRGTGAILAREGRVAELAAEIAAGADLERQKKTRGGALKLGEGALTRLLSSFEEKAEELRMEAGSEEGPSLAPLASTFGTLVAQSSFVDVEQVAGAIQVSMWKPDFFLYQNISPWRLPKSLHPETMARKHHELLRVWTEVCKFLLVQFGMFRPFGVGWVFDSEYDPTAGEEAVIAALYRRHEGMDWLLVNPVSIDRRGYGDDISFVMAGDRYSLKSPADVEELVSMAVHEITHMQGFSTHTDAYAAALTSNMQAVFRIAPVIKKIVREARAAVREVREETKAAREESVREPESPKFVWEREGSSAFRYGSLLGEGTVVGVRETASGRFIPRLWSREGEEWKWIDGNQGEETEERAKRVAEEMYLFTHRRR